MTHQNSSIAYTGQQLQALEAIQAWYNSGAPARQHFFLAGPAGVGKTTIARAIPEWLGFVSAIYGAYTGKAAHVLNRKGCSPARTLHSLIYTPAANAHRKELDEVRAALRTTIDPAIALQLGARLRVVEQLASEPGWVLNPESVLNEVDLLICDEVSMVNEEMAIDLLSFGKPIIVLGDPEQLPPVRGEGFFTSAAPDFYLSEVLRQALDSPILSLATRVREGEPLTGHQDASVAELLQVDQVLCGRNVTRWDLISRMRAAQGFPPGFPVPGDRIMCLANNRALGVFNGQQFDVLHNLGQDGNQRAWKLVLRDDDGEQLEISADWGGFTGQEGQDLAKRNARFSGRIALMTFAQAITVHKSQGSEWPSVALLDEGYVFHRGDPDTPRRWTYTGITRAAERLHVIGAVR